MDAVAAVKSNDASAIKAPKPAVPKKPERLTMETDAGRKTHVRDMIRRLQEKERESGIRGDLVRKAGRRSVGNEKEEMDAQASKQTLEDLKAIDEDIEKLRKQIEERDKIISALREAAEAKDKKLDNLMMEYSKLRSNTKMDMDTSPEPNRSTSSSPSSPPLCNGELCWTDSFVNKNYHEPVYAQLLNDHTALQKVYNDLRTKLECQQNERKTDGENAINLIMAEQIRALKEREAQLIWEAEELREQNDLMEFRILELEECRKEFIEKEMTTEGKERGEKIMWRERDIEEVSDSGVMSLPTSEDLTSDSELGEAIRNYSPLGPVTNLGLTTENSNSDPPIADFKLKKSLKSSECLQESGIFVDSEPSDCAIPTATHSKACQTESVLDKTLLDIIDSSCDLFLSKNPGYLEDSRSDDLTTEISKLSVIQKRIQQKTSPPKPRSPHTVVSCPHSDSVRFYEERLLQLEEKLKIYESTGDERDVLLAKRLQKEVELAYRVKELTGKVTCLEESRRKLEEEKCEFEEAENDARFQCQRLEIRVEELLEKNTELELELERQKVIMSEEKRRERKKGSLEGLLSKYEQRNFELEEKEVETRQRLSMIEAAMPAIVAYNVYRMTQNPEFSTIMSTKTGEDKVSEQSAQITDPMVFQRLEEVLNDQKKLRKDYKKVAESAVDSEKALRNKIEELESKAAKDREVLEEMTNTLKAFKAEERNEREFGSSNGPDELFDELKHMVATEIQLRAQIERLEQKEQAYMQSLEKADEIWADMEADYKQRLKEAEETNNELMKRISMMEKAQAEMEKALEEKEVKGAKSESKGQEIINLEELLAENEKLKEEITRNMEEKLEEHKKLLEVENISLKEELKKREADLKRDERNYHELKEVLNTTRMELEREKEVGERLKKDLEEKSQSVTSLEVCMQGQISELTQELTQKSKELSSLEVTVAELREEVETLENKVGELVETIQTSIKNQEEGLNWMEVIRGNQKLFLNITPTGNGHPSLSLGSSTTVSLQGDSTWSSSPLQNQVCHVCIAQKNPFRDSVIQQVHTMKEEIPAASEILMKKENKPPTLEIRIPNRYQSRFMVFAAVTFPRQEIKVLLSKSMSVLTLRQKECSVMVEEVPNAESEREIKAREEEIFQLSLKNTELQQTLERMEEESKWKDKEFEELQRIASEIRREQESLQELYGAMEKTEGGPKREESAFDVCDYVREPFKPPSIDLLQIINPIVAKTSEQIATTISSLQIAFDNLQSKYRSKSFLPKPLLGQLRQRGDNNDIEDVARHLALEFVSETDMHTKRLDSDDRPLTADRKKPHDDRSQQKPEEKPPQPPEADSNPFNTLHTNFLSKSSSAVPSLRSPLLHLNKTLDVDPDFTFTAPITLIRKIGDDGIFLEWDVSQKPPNVTGFEIKVNGLLTHRVRSASRNKALLRPLNLKGKISIHVFAVSENGRSMKSSYISYPDEYFLLSRE